MNGRTDRCFFSCYSGGLILAEKGEFCGGKKFSSARRDLKTNTVDIVYSDGNAYKMTCNRVETDTEISLSNIKEYWNGVEINV